MTDHTVDASMHALQLRCICMHYVHSATQMLYVASIGAYTCSDIFLPIDCGCLYRLCSHAARKLVRSDVEVHN